MTRCETLETIALLASLVRDLEKKLARTTNPKLDRERLQEAKRELDDALKRWERTERE